jgi:hypothetical protein
MKSMLHIGADAEKLKAALPEITKSIIAIIGSPAGDDVKKAAISALSGAFTVQNINISGCDFSTGEPLEER